MREEKIEAVSRRDLVVAAGAAGLGALASHLVTRQSLSTRESLSGDTATSATGRTPAPGQAVGAAPSGSAVPLEPPGAQSPDAKVPQATRRLGWAVVGLGKLALEEVLPAFAASSHSRLAALVSGHPDKARQVAAAHGLDTRNLYTYDTFDTIRNNPDIDIVYIILPNSMHAEYTVRAFQAGKHVLCEKPMATSLEDCQRMIQAGQQAGKKLMIAYRLHYEPATRRATEICRRGELGRLYTIEATNVEVVQAPNIRLSGKLGGGPLGDIGIYCINGARFLVGEEPVEVTGMQQRPNDDPRFREVAAGYAWTMRFPSGAILHADSHFAAARSNHFRAHFEKGFLEMQDAYAYAPPRLHLMRENEGMSQVKTEKVNQFAAEMDHFSRCVMDNKTPDTPGEEGLADLRVVKAIEEAARTGTTVKLAT